MSVLIALIKLMGFCVMFDNLYNTSVMPREFNLITSLADGETLTKIAMRLYTCVAALANASYSVCVR